MTAEQGRRVRRGSAAGLLKDGAREVFAERGYSATTREIATRAGVSHELIFRYFGTKEKLFYDAVVTPLMDAVDELHQTWIRHPNMRTMSHEQLVERFTTTFYEFMSKNQSIARAMVHLFVSGPGEGELERLRERISDTLAPMIAPIDEYLAAQGLRHSSTALQLRLVMLFVGAAATFLASTYRTEDAVPGADAIVAELSHFVLRGLYDK
jgi:AcrR family transcriptional regulator